MRIGKVFGGIANDVIDSRVGAKGQGVEIARAFETFASRGRVRQFKKTVAEPKLCLRVIRVERGRPPEA